MSATGANADTISDTGDVTARSRPLSYHAVRIDKESLPTGTASPSAGHSSSPTARTIAYSAKSSAPCPAAAIQLADSRMSPSDSTSAAAMFSTASATARRAEAGPW